ncbi:hypothetical protein LC048_02780 [Mesobacillus subterraneus]|uniref:hypothetical protein n=1 Tax=Mesobacillus subterraneus TaxID=285983 RepID=UPI001CFDCDF4|nr:hypothetical protein [Mesobacillus subterraneus]WLR55942.1 hypothetical protein LC048_02780 [Mesobacillus subterraneus]
MSIKYRYELDSWQALLQQLNNLVSSKCKYYFWHLTYLPDSKRDKWGSIDLKLIERYQTNKTPKQRLSIRKKGYARFMYLRWEHIVFIVHTEGQIPAGVEQDKFYDIRKIPINFELSDLVGFQIENLKGKTSIKLNNNTFNTVKEELRMIAKSGDILKMRNTFHKLNGFPSWSGIITQKKVLAEFLTKEAKKHNVNSRNFSYSSLFIRMQRKAVKTWR